MKQDFSQIMTVFKGIFNAETPVRTHEIVILRLGLDGQHPNGNHTCLELELVNVVMEKLTQENPEIHGGIESKVRLSEAFVLDSLSRIDEVLKIRFWREDG